MQGFCPPSSRRQGAGVPRPVECDARTLSKERVQKRSPRLLRISETTAERGEYLLGGVFTRPCDKNGTQGVCVAQMAVTASFVLTPALCILHPLFPLKEQCNNARDSHRNHAEI